jgi:hypothetical protein
MTTSMFSSRAVALILLATLAGCDGNLIAEASSEAGLAAESPACAVLATCCPSLPSDVSSSCVKAANQALNSECGLDVAALVMNGYCPVRVDAGALVDAAPRTDGGTDAGVDASRIPPACALLGVCCQSPALPADQMTTCSTFLASGEESQCSTLYASLSGSEECGSVGGTCLQLQSCCTSESFPAQFQLACTGAVNAGITADCANQLSEYQTAAYCVGGDAGITGACGMLDLCCPGLPADQQETCFQIARSSNANDCDSAYAGYYAVGYCN